MDVSENHTSDSTLKKRSNNGGISLLDGLRRTFVNFLRHPQSSALPSKESLQQQNMTLPLFSKLDNEFGNQIFVSDHPTPDTDIVHQYGVRRFSSYTDTPESVRAEFIRLDKVSGGTGELLQGGARNQAGVHAFCAIPLELDTFCDYCNQPIWGLGWGPVCQRCADCHMTCHWLCKDKVKIPCEVSPPSARSTAKDNCDCNGPVGDDEFADYDFADNVAVEHINPNEEGYLRPTASTSPFQKVLRSPQTTAMVTSRVVSMGAEALAPPVLANADGRRPSGGSPSTLRPHSQFSLFTSGDTSLKVDHEENKMYQESWPPPSILPSSPQHHESLLQPRRHNCNRRSSRLMSRRHTTGVSLTSTTFDTYDISSLDQRSIKERGISLWQLSPAASNTPPVIMSSRMQATQLAAVTGHQTGAEDITYTEVVIGPRNAMLPWNPEELTRRLEIFNVNDFGLHARMAPELPSGDCEGQVRVHINLIRPVRMVLTARPPSIFDVVGGIDDDDGDEYDDEDSPLTDEVAVATTLSCDETQQQTEAASFVKRQGKAKGRITSFRLPRGSSKLLHVHLSTSASQVISSLLARFNIDDNPQKFALYEHTIFGENEVSVRKLFGNESPLGLFLQWTLDSSEQADGEISKARHHERFNSLLAIKRLVLQENETGDIEWSCFSEAELRTFLGILNREEADYRCRIELKYQIRKREILRLMSLRAKCQQRNNTPTSNSVTANDTICKVEDSSNVTPTTEGDPVTPPLLLSSDDAPRTQDTDLVDVGDSETDKSISFPVPDFSPLPPTITVADEIASPLKLNQTHLLTKAQHKKNAKLAKNKAKKLKSFKEKVTKPAKSKSHMWLKKKK